MSCSHCGGELEPKGEPCDKAWQCAACSRLHLEGAMPMDYEDVLIRLLAQHGITVGPVGPDGAVTDVDGAETTGRKRESRST